MGIQAIQIYKLLLVTHFPYFIVVDTEIVSQECRGLQRYCRTHRQPFALENVSNCSHSSQGCLCMHLRFFLHGQHVFFPKNSQKWRLQWPEIQYHIYMYRGRPGVLLDSQMPICLKKGLKISIMVSEQSFNTTQIFTTCVTCLFRKKRFEAIYVMMDV